MARVNLQSFSFWTEHSSFFLAQTFAQVYSCGEKEQGGPEKLPLPLLQLPHHTLSSSPLRSLGRSWFCPSCFPKHSLLPQHRGFLSISVLPQMFSLPSPGCPAGQGAHGTGFCLPAARVSTASPKAETSLPLPWAWALAPDTGVGQSCAAEHVIFIRENLQAVVSSSDCFWGQPHSIQGFPTAKAVIDSEECADIPSKESDNKYQRKHE